MSQSVLGEIRIAGFTITDRTGEPLTGWHFNGHTGICDGMGHLWVQRGTHPFPTSVREVPVVVIPSEAA